MTATLHRLGAGGEAGLYYTSDPNREVHNRDDYYAADGGGVWHSTGETIVANGAPVAVETFRDLCAGIDPRTGKALVRGAGEKHRAGVDVTFTPGKSVPVLWMAGGAEQRARIEAMHRVAVTRALTMLVDEELVVVRYGGGGAHRVRPSDLIIARFDHFTTRAGDPNLHTHCVIMNVAGSPVTSARYAATHLTTETEGLFRAQRLLGAAYRSALAEQLATLGLEFRPAGRGQYEIAGLPQDLLEVFSKRSHDIEEQVGRDASAAQKEVAALNTRQAKTQVPTGEALEARWRQELHQTGCDPWQLALNLELEQTNIEVELTVALYPEPAAVAGAGPVAVAAATLFLTENVLDRPNLLERALIEASLKGIGPDAVYKELESLESSGALLRLDDSHWTTPAIAATEAEMLRAADRPAERDWISAEILAETLRDHEHLSPEQAEAVGLVCQSDGVSLVEAGAGTGKTTLSKAIVAAASRAGVAVIGLAPSWVAADELAHSIGIDALAIAKWRTEFARGTATPFDANTVILVDEAGMVGTSDMATVLVAAKQAGAKVVLLGDRRQLQSVAGASALSAVADILERSATLSGVRRQDVAWQRSASVAMARGHADAGLRAYARHGQVELVHGEAAARKAVISKWVQAREQYGDDVLIITRRNVDAIALNNEARQVLRQSGFLGEAEAYLPAIGRDDKVRDLALSVGDKIRFGETLPEIGIRNGTRAVVQALGGSFGLHTRLTLQLESGQNVSVTWDELTPKSAHRKPSPPRISHAYAGTAHSVQGRTASATLMHIARQPDAREIYVGLTRHRLEAHVVVEADRLDAACRQRQVDSRIPPTRTAMLERLFSEARQYREKANVVDYVADRNEFVATGRVVISGSEQRWSMRSTLMACLSLSQLAKPLRGLWLTLTSAMAPEPGKRAVLPEHFRALRQAHSQRIRTKERDPRRSNYER